MTEKREDIQDAALVAARVATDTGRRYDLDAVIEALGYTREQLLADNEDEWLGDG